MKITCPNCQKNYVINKAKLPPGVKTAKCKVCGLSMPLKKAPADASSKPARIIKIACLYCGQKHNLRPEKIPATVNTINCKSCGRPVPLSQAMSSAPVHSLKKESPADEPAAKPVKAPARADNLIRFRCANCGKKYKIGRQKIPPRAAAVKCKACGHKIKLPPAPAKATTGDRPQPKMQPVGTSGAKSDLMAAEASSAIQRPRKKKWLFALAAVVLLIVIAGALANRHIVKLGWLNRFFSRESGPVTESTPLLDSEPLLALNLNVPLILDTLEEHLEPDKKMPRLRMMMTMMESMDLKQIKIYLYTPTQNQLLPVILAYGSSRQQLEKVFNSQEPFKKYFTHKSGDSYRLKKEALEDAAKYKLPRQPYEVTLIDNRVALAPVSFSDTIRKNPQLLTNSPIAGFAQSIATPHDLASFAIRLPAGINQGWEKKIQNHPALQSIPQTAMIADMGAAIMSQLTGSLKHVAAFGLGFRFTGSEERSLTYAQQFRPGVDGQKIFRQLEAPNPADTEINGIIKNLIELFKDQRYQHTLNFEDNRLALQFSWSEKEDEAFLTALAAATIGQLFAGSMELTPTQGAVETRYATEPYIVMAVDSDRLKAIIPQMISDSLFPGHYWSMGAKPKMTLDLDTIDMPNAALAELTYEVKSIQSPDGKNVLRNEENQNKPRIKPGSLFPANIALNLKEGTPPDDLA
ncbi:MAG: zinc-ribbon domain-containing protein, partial [Deltaproteobacteria bacterium]|nr:zinc-ribbon domain-containing protein [Deltaproteobacteria bacterium]